MPAPLLRTENVVRTYHTDGQEVPALRGVSFELPRGVLAALKGRSGSGKTTLLNLLGGLDRPTSGEIFFEAQSLTKLNESQLTHLRRHRIGFIFQSFALLPTYSAFENVEFMLRLSGLRMRERAERTRRYLHVVGLAKWINHRPDEMSGGQQQRLAIARALVTQPTLILADEPTGELDTVTTRQILSLFKHVIAREGVTILTTTHDPIVDEYADIIYTLQDGKLMTTKATSVLPG
ncbi:MAG: ABC transporter ATP-binding protein [Chloroflexota bacterium]